MEEWMRISQSSIVKIVLKGNEGLARMYINEASNFLYILKNRMNVGGIESLSHNYVLPDGTTIHVSSGYGNNQIIINSPPDKEPAVVLQPTEEGPPSCNLIFIKMPSVVQPMKNPGRIVAGEVQGVDYIKTFFKTNLENCPDCQPIRWSWAYKFKKPFEALHYHDNNTTPVTDEPDNHLVYSLNPPPYFQIIKKGAQGTNGYIVWKAFTENPDPLRPYSNYGISRTGEAVILVKAEILDANGIPLCHKEQKVLVDCCKKDPSLRKTEIWWEGVNCNCTPFMIYPEAAVCGAICKAPNVMALGGFSGLIEYACVSPQQPLYGIPDILGECLPLEWTLEGPFEFWGGTNKNSNLIYLNCLSSGCEAGGSITLRDRCGGEYRIDLQSCCATCDPISLSYTSLLMSCGQSQDFSVLGGCAPYTWAITSGGGTITQSGHYIAPATNVNCTDNPTIQVTDCCGNVASVSLAINCYSGAEAATSPVSLGDLDCKCISPGGCSQGVCCKFHLIVKKYKCDGTLLSNCDITQDCSSYPLPGDCTNPYYTNTLCWAGHDCNTLQCGGCSPYTCNAINDCRTVAMKQNGCCPLNPETGLPY